MLLQVWWFLVDFNPINCDGLGRRRSFRYPVSRTPLVSLLLPNRDPYRRELRKRLRAAYPRWKTKIGQIMERSTRLVNLLLFSVGTMNAQTIGVGRRRGALPSFKFIQAAAEALKLNDCTIFRTLFWRKLHPLSFVKPGNLLR